MKIFSFPNLSSTQTQAQELITLHPELQKFIVIADEQSAGKGQSSRSWQSPSGNIYATFVQKFRGDIPPQFSQMSLKVGWIICEWLKHQYKISARIKWPNDIYFLGGKIAGILCETISKGQEFYLCCGIGLNIEVAPLPTSRCLQDFFPEARLHELRGGFLQFITEYFDRDFSLNFTGEYLFAPGSLYRIEGDNFYFTELTKEGFLDLKNNHDQERIVISSSALEYVPWHERTFSIVDEGNSQAKFFISEKGQLTKSESVSEKSDALFRASVLESSQFKNAFTIPKQKVYLSDSRYNLDQIGIDRFCFLETIAKKMFHKSHSAVLVSLGTATTIDIIDSSRVHLGGWILPGIQMSLDMLFKKTSKLPQLNWRNSEQSIPVNTEEAMICGVRDSIFASIELAKRKLDSHSVEVYVTGGWSPMLNVPNSNVLPFAVAEGAQIILTGF